MKKKMEKIVIDKLSFVTYEKKEDEYELIDELYDKRYVVNEIVIEIYKNTDGVKSLQDIMNCLVAKYDVDEEMLKQDIYDIYDFMKKNKLILCKNTGRYYFIKLYYLILLIKKEDKYVS